MKKIVTLLMALVLCLGISMTAFATDKEPQTIPSPDGSVLSENGYTVKNVATQEELRKIAAAAEKAMQEQLAISVTAKVKLIAAGDYQLYDKDGAKLPDGVVPTGNEDFYFNIPDGDSAEYKHDAPVYVVHEYAPGKFELIEGRVVQLVDGTRKIEVNMNQFSPTAFFKVMLGGKMIRVTYKDGVVISGRYTGYTDVAQGAWNYEPIKYVSSRNLMTGMDSSKFGPEVFLSRAHFATILYRMENQPEVTYDAGAFPDVADAQFYTAPAMWAKSKGVIEGYVDGSFGPADEITREQMAVMMYRYAKMKKLDTSAKGDLGSFPDGSSVSGFAQEAMEWAVGIKLIQGDNGKINPQGKAKREQCATIIMRYMQGYEL